VEFGRLARRIGAPVVVVLAWQAAVSIGGFGGGFVPTPVEVVKTLAIWIFGFGVTDRYSATWLPSVIASLQRALEGFCAASIAGLVVGILIGRFATAADILDPILQTLRPIPVSAWVPFSMVFFGISPASAIFLVALGAFFPVALNTVAGARHVSELHLRSARMLGAGFPLTLRSVILPSALPSIFVGLRLAMGLSWVLLIVAEMVAVKSGLGYDLWNAYYYARMDVIVAAMLTIGVLGFLSDRVVLLVSHRALRWRAERDI
jgi:NitT/TauT family transport system permease protein